MFGKQVILLIIFLVNCQIYSWSVCKIYELMVYEVHLNFDKN